LLGQQTYFCDVDNVGSIQIVRIDKVASAEDGFEYTVLSHIDDSKDFAERLNNIDHSTNWGDPIPIQVQHVVIRIEYINGDHDLIHQGAQCFYRSGKYKTGYFFFDDDQFDELISGYLAEST